MVNLTSTKRYIINFILKCLIFHIFRDLSTSSSATCSIDFSSVDYSNYNDPNNINKSDCDAILNTDDTVILIKANI